MTKDEFLARAANAYDMGLVTPERMTLMERWLDVVMREGHSRVCDVAQLFGLPRGQDQWNSVRDFWYLFGGETGRLLKKSEGDYQATLANDADGYSVVKFAAILRHPCQLCAADPNAWHTLQGTCNHRSTSDITP